MAKLETGDAFLSRNGSSPDGGGVGCLLVQLGDRQVNASPTDTEDGWRK
jgi:hypothetical protein